MKFPPCQLPRPIYNRKVRSAADGLHRSARPRAWLSRLSVSLLVAGGAATVGAEPGPDQVLEPLKELSLEELGQIRVTSVSKKEENLNTAAAAITVLTQEDIRRSGLTSIPELLRLVPGVHVGRIDANKWAIGSRGFGSQFGNQLLVMVDGRTVYTPLFSGVFWDVQDLMVEDIERIEIIRGPGATVWGANAVNGVINVITKSSKDTQGVLVSGGAGSEKRGFGSLRYGGKLGEDVTYRFYLTHREFDDFVFANGNRAADGWNMTRAGFRTDWTPNESDTLTLQGDLYSGQTGSTASFASLLPPFSTTRNFQTDLSGGNVLGRWEHRFSDTSRGTLQVYYDHMERNDPQWDLTLQTFDLELQHQFALGERHDIVWGLGYRSYWDEIAGSFSASVTPATENLQWVSGFVQDEITLVEDRLRLTLGSKFEHNEYSGWEIQPSARLAWTPHAKHSVWGAVSRAVRTPSRFDHDGRLNVAVIPGAPTVIGLTGSSDLESEEMIAYELGYRVQPTRNLSFDLAAFYNVYDNLIVFEGQPPFFEPMPAPAHMAVLSRAGNGMSGETYGMELSSTWQVTDNWRLGAGYSWFHANLDAPRARESAAKVERQSPTHMFNIRSTLELPWDLELDTALYYVDDIVGRELGQTIPSYLRLDLRLGWRPTEDLEFSIIGQNLLEPQHPEFGGTSSLRTEVERAVYGKATLRF